MKLVLLFMNCPSKHREVELIRDQILHWFANDETLEPRDIIILTPQLNKYLHILNSIFHDIKGANIFEIDSLLITSGIHELYFDSTNPQWESKINVLKKTNIIPTYLCSKFQF